MHPVCERSCTDSLAEKRFTIKAAATKKISIPQRQGTPTQRQDTQERLLPLWWNTSLPSKISQFSPRETAGRP
jgi:hypothetical protein